MEGWIDMYKRKTKDIWQLITNYGYGSEVECEYEDEKEALADFDKYRKEKNEGYLPSLISVMLMKRRIRI